MKNNLEVLAHPDGTWLVFKSGTATAMVQVEAFANKGKLRSIIDNTILKWCEDRQREAHSKCTRCGERIEEHTAPEGCRDPKCPRQNAGG